MIVDNFLKHVKSAPEKTAICFKDRRISYKELADMTASMAETMKEMGITKETNILLLLPNSIEFAVIMLSAAKLGAVIVPIPTSYKDEAIAKAIEASDATHVAAAYNQLAKIIENTDIEKENCLSSNTNNAGSITFQEACEKYADIPLEAEELTGDEPYILTMTSGSTGDPKPIIFSQNTKLMRSFSARDCYGLDSSIICLAATPMYHSLAQRMVLLPLLLGGTAVIMDKFTAKGWLNTVQETKVTFTMPVSSQLATVFEEYKENEYDISSLQVLVSSSALITEDLKRALTETLPCEIHEIYGASEVGVITNLSPNDGSSRLGTVGKALPGIDMKIVDENDNEVPYGETGEIICKSPTAFLKYYKKEAETAKAMRGGYFHTGDLGRMDEEGFLTFAGRQKEIIITGGINVYPKDIENIIMSTGMVRECAVVGIDDEYFGEAVLAVVVPNETFDKRKLRLTCARNLADYQQPLGVETVDELPKNGMGKVMKSTIKEMFSDLDLSKDIRNIL